MSRRDVKVYDGDVFVGIVMAATVMGLYHLVGYPNPQPGEKLRDVHSVDDGRTVLRDRFRRMAQAGTWRDPV